MARSSARLNSGQATADGGYATVYADAEAVESILKPLFSAWRHAEHRATIQAEMAERMVADVKRGTMGNGLPVPAHMLGDMIHRFEYHGSADYVAPLHELGTMLDSLLVAPSDYRERATALNSRIDAALGALERIQRDQLDARRGAA